MWWIISILYFIVFIIVLRSFVRERKHTNVNGWDSGYTTETHWSLWKIFLSLIWPITLIGFVIFWLVEQC